MASFNISANHSFYQKQMIDKAFQSLFNDSMRFECPSIIEKFGNSSKLNLSSMRADLFTSMKLPENKKKWRKELKKRSKDYRKRHRGEQVSGYLFNQSDLQNASHISSPTDSSQATSSQPFVFSRANIAPPVSRAKKPSSSSNFEFARPEVPHGLQPSVSSSKRNPKPSSSDFEFVRPKVFNSPLTSLASKKSETYRVRNLRGHFDAMSPSSPRPRESKRRLLQEVQVQQDQRDQRKRLKPCKVVLQQKDLTELARDERNRLIAESYKKEKAKKNHVFEQWIFRKDENGDITVKGRISGSPTNEFWSTSEIVKRIDKRTLLTVSGKLCILKGKLMSRYLTSRGYPMELVEKFADGFPPQWKNMLRAKILPKAAVEVKESRHPRAVKKVVQEPPEESEDEDEDEESESDEEDFLPISQKLSVIKETAPDTRAVEENRGDECDYLFDVLSQNAHVVVAKPDPIPPPVRVAKKQSSRKNQKPVKIEVVEEVDTIPSPSSSSSSSAPSPPLIPPPSSPLASSPPKPRVMTRSRSSLEGKKSRPSKNSQKNTKTIPKDQNKTTTKKVAEDFSSPHPLSNTISEGVPKTQETEPSKKPPQRPSRSKKQPPPPKKTQATQPSKKPPQRPSRSKKQPPPPKKTQATQPSKKQPKKPSGSKKQTKASDSESSESESSDDESSDSPPPKTTTKRKKGTQPERMMVNEWTNEEVQKLLTAMSSVPKTDGKFWQKVSRKVGRTPKECSNYYCSCDLSNLDWKDGKKKDVKKNEKKEEPKTKTKAKRKNILGNDISSSYEDDFFSSENFFGNEKKFRLSQDGQLDNIFADLDVRTPSVSSDKSFQTPMSKFFLTPVSERQTPASTYSDGEIRVDMDNADRCVKEFKKKQKKGAGRRKVPKRLAELKSQFKPKSLQLGALVDELNKINSIPQKSDNGDETDDSNQDYFLSESD